MSWNEENIYEQTDEIRSKEEEGERGGEERSGDVSLESINGVESYGEHLYKLNLIFDGYSGNLNL